MTTNDVTPPKGALSLDTGTASRRPLKALKNRIRKYLSGSLVTLDIDRSGIRLLETRGGVIKKWASVALEAGGSEEGEVSDRRYLSRMIKQLMDSNRVKPRKVRASLSGLYSVSRVLSVPAVTPAGITTQEFIRELARETMPVAMDKLYLSWQTVATSEGERKVFLIAVPRNTLDNEVRALRAAGASPHILELKAMALTRAVNQKQAFIINIGPASFDIVIVANGMPEIMRTVAWQQEELTLEETVEQLVTTMELTVGFHQSRYPDIPLDPATPLFITGQMSGDAALVDKLQARLKYPIGQLAPALEYPADLPVSQYAVNIGLALKETTPSKNLEEGKPVPLDINLLPEIYSPWRLTVKQLSYVGLIAVAIAPLFPLYQVANEAWRETASLEIKLNVLNDGLAQRQLEIKSREPIQKAIDEYYLIVNMGGGFTEDLEVINGEAERLGVQVNDIDHEGNSITVDCEAEDYVAFRAYKTALEESGRFSTPVAPPEGYPYTTGGTITLEPVTDKAE